MQPPKAEYKGKEGGGAEPTPAYFLQCEATTTLYPMVLLLLSYCFPLLNYFCLVTCLPEFVPFLQCEATITLYVMALLLSLLLLFYIAFAYRIVFV